MVIVNKCRFSTTTVYLELSLLSEKGIKNIKMFKFDLYYTVIDCAVAQHKLEKQKVAGWGYVRTTG